MKKKEKYEQKPWSLEDIYSSQKSEAYQADLQELDQLTKDFESYRSVLSTEIDLQKFLTIIHTYERITFLASKLMEYAVLLFSGDTQNAEYAALYGQTEAKITEIMNKVLFFSLWWKSLENDEADKLIDRASEYSYFLQEMRLSKPFMLSEKEEKIINIKNLTGSSALNNLYESITNRYQFHLTIDGGTKNLTRDGLMVYAKSENPDIRKAAYTELYRVYGEDGTILSQIYQNICRDWYEEEVNLRHFTTPISARNLSNNIPDKVTSLLLEICQKNRNIFQDYFTVKKELLSINDFHRYDIYAPLHESNRRYSFDEAFHIVKRAYASFDPSFEKMVDKIYDAGHIDSEVRHGKRGGAFCLTISPEYTPWVLLNFQGTTNDVSTLAHELGHGIHSILSDKLSIFTQQACLPLAETASTFGEMLLSDMLINEEKDKNVQRNLLVKQLDDNYATIQRQAYFALFEIKAHDAIANGADMNNLNELYMKNLKEQFGSCLEVDDFFKWEWISIPHFFASPFYVYAYSFGQLLVLSLYKQYQNEGSSFIPKYVNLLSSGGNKAPESILSEAGFDFYDPAFWQGGFDMMREKIEKLKAIS